MGNCWKDPLLMGANKRMKNINKLMMRGIQSVGGYWAKLRYDEAPTKAVSAAYTGA